MRKIPLVLLVVLLIGLGYWFYQSYQMTKTEKNNIIQNQTENESSINDSNTQETPQSQQETSMNNSNANLFLLEIYSPKNQAVVNDPDLKISGVTVPNATVYINENEQTADSQGNFSLTVSLDEGENALYVLAHDDLGNFGQQELTVTLESF